MEDLTFGSRLKHAWNAFTNRDPTIDFKAAGASYAYRPDRPRLTRGNERSIVTSVYNRIALDVAAVNIKHCRMDENGRYISDIKSGLNDCLTIEANIDQTGRSLIQDIVMSMLDEGCVAIVPVDTSLDPKTTNSYDILSMRTAKILEWKPSMVRVRIYNDRTGNKEELWVPKNTVAIIENPLYAVINEPNSTMQRLVRKLNLLDVIDEQSGSGKLDLIIQLPYTIKTEARRAQADQRLRDIEDQLKGPYGIAYTDGTERITQLNRPVENNLMKQIEYLTTMLYSQLGITQEILNGTADEKTMLNYYNRSIEPIVSAITDEMKRKFLTKTARTQNQTIAAFRDPFKLVPVNDIAEIADKFTRNEIMSSNEIRQVIGMKPSNDPKADQLVNSNISQPNGMMEPGMEDDMTNEDYGQAFEGLDDLDAQLDEVEESLEHSELMHYASPYYNPVKAHEYYMKNRELKGRMSTAKLNDEGRKVADYVKNQLNTERQGKVQSHRDATDIEIQKLNDQKTANIKTLREQKQQKVEAHRSAMQSKIDSLREQLSGMSKEDRSKNKDRIKAEIAELRAGNKQERARLQEEYNASSQTEKENFGVHKKNLNTAHKDEKSRLKEEYDGKIADELDKIRSESKYLKTSKKKGSSSKSKPLSYYMKK